MDKRQSAHQKLDAEAKKTVYAQPRTTKAQSSSRATTASGQTMEYATRLNRDDIPRFTAGRAATKYTDPAQDPLFIWTLNSFAGSEVGIIASKQKQKHHRGLQTSTRGSAEAP